MNQCSPFVRKAHQIVCDQETDNIVSWNCDGKSFTIHDPHAFEQVVLPNYFKHNNLCSFVRQLNTYGFHKITTDIMSGCQEFSHKFFLRDNTEYLTKVIRRSNVRNRPDHQEQTQETSSSFEMMETLQNLIQRQQQSDQLLASVTQELEETKRTLKSLLENPQTAAADTHRGPFVGKNYFYETYITSYPRTQENNSRSDQRGQQQQFHPQSKQYPPLDDLVGPEQYTDIQELMNTL